MRRLLALVGSAILPTMLWAVPLPEDPPTKEAAILVLDDCDEQYKDKAAYADNLTLLDFTGRQRWRVSGLNNCQTIGSSRMVTTDPVRKCVWILENVAGQIRRFDLRGKETLAIAGIKGSALAVDAETGNVWVLAGPGAIGKGNVLVYDGAGKRIALYGISGWDIVYDAKAKAFWIAEKKLTKISAARGEVLTSIDVSTFCASSVDVDPRSGAVWVAVREHQQVLGSSNRLLKFDGDGKELAAVDLAQKIPFRLSVDPKTGDVWVANLRKSIERFSPTGEACAEYSVPALAVQVDPAGKAVWVVTGTEVQRMSPRGEVTLRVPHAANTSSAWITPLD